MTKKKYTLQSVMISIILITLATVFPPPAVADRNECTICVNQTFNEHGAVMMFVEQETGNILYANDAAADFYGYSKEELTSITIGDIDPQEPDELAAKMEAAAEKHENFLVLKHRLANGELRTVEIYSYPTEYNGKQVLYSVIHDITPRALLEAQHKRMEYAVIAFIIAIFAVLVLLIIDLQNKTGKLARVNQNLRYWNELRRTFTDADAAYIFLKDENLKYVFVNKALKNFFGQSYGKIAGRDNCALFGEDIPEEFTELDREVLEKRKMITRTIPWRNRYFRATKFPARMPNGAMGVGAYTSDVTEEHKQDRARSRILAHNKLLLEMLTRAFTGKQEQLDYALHELLKITGSRHGYIYFYSEEKEEFTLNSWTKEVMDACTIQNPLTSYQLAKTGIWGEVVRKRTPIVVNNFTDPNPLKKGYPPGHVELEKFMSVPVIIDDKIVAVVGLANKDTDYDDTDVLEMTTLMSGVWNAVQRREARETLIYEHNKYFQTLLSIGDGVMVVDRDKNIEFLNLVASQLTGWAQEEAIGQNYKKVLVLTHEREEEGFAITDPVEKVFITGQAQELDNNTILTAKDGTQYYLEDSAAPIMDDKQELAGVVLVFRDITERRKQQKKIEHMSFHDSLTGLYNRHFFEEELRRLDTERNLPISVLIADVDGLKLTNDIFGHSTGDTLLRKTARAMKEVCRADDIICRWGGDEFMLLLPRTSSEEAADIARRIKDELSAQKVRAIRCSISISHDTKTTVEEDIIQTLDKAEAKMYAAKTLEQDNIQCNELSAVINTLYADNTRESAHARKVGEICLKLGDRLGLPESSTQKLAEAGRLHDIGKIVLSPELLKRGYPVDLAEEQEMSKHPVVGYRILNYFFDTVELAETVLAHHERWDGTGYPKGLRDEEIPLHARIISIVEAYDRMLHPPANRPAKSREEAIKEIKRCAGTQFDPHIAEVFTKMLLDEI